MKAIALIIALVLLYYRPRNQKGTGWYRSYVNWLHRVFNPNSSRQGIIAWLMAVGLPALLMINVYFLILFKFGLLAALLVNIVVLYFVLQFSNFGLETENIYQELSAEKLDDARLSYTAWQNKPMEDLQQISTCLTDHRGHSAPRISWFICANFVVCIIRLGGCGAVSC